MKSWCTLLHAVTRSLSFSGGEELFKSVGVNIAFLATFSRHKSSSSKVRALAYLICGVLIC
jgi:hypothetical protein